MSLTIALVLRRRFAHKMPTTTAITQTIAPTMMPITTPIDRPPSSTAVTIDVFSIAGDTPPTLKIVVAAVAVVGIGLELTVVIERCK